MLPKRKIRKCFYTEWKTWQTLQILQQAWLTKLNQDLLRCASLIETVCQSCGRRLVDYTNDIETCDGTCVLGRLPLVVVEVCGHCDDCLIDRLASICFRIPLDLLKDERRDLLRGVLLVECLDLLGELKSLSMRVKEDSEKAGSKLNI